MFQNPREYHKDTYWQSLESIYFYVVYKSIERKSTEQSYYFWKREWDREARDTIASFFYVFQLFACAFLVNREQMLGYNLL